MALDKDKFLNQLKETYGPEADLPYLLKEGLIRKENGAAFSALDSEIQNFEQIQNYLEAENSKVVLFTKVDDPKDSKSKIDKRLGCFKNASKNGSIDYLPDSPDKGNTYGRADMSNLEDAKPSKELADFMHALEQVLKEQADLNPYAQNDRPRLKGYYETENGPIERDMFKTFEFNQDGTVSSKGADTELDGRDCFNSVQNEIFQNDFDFTTIIAKVDAPEEQQVQGILHQAYEMMALAKEGRLMVTKPGELASDSHPLVFKDGKLSMLPSRKDATMAQVDDIAGYSILSKLHSRKTAEEDRLYADELAKGHGKIYNGILAATTDGLEKVLGTAYTEALAMKKSREEYVQDLISAQRLAANDSNAFYEELRQHAEDDGMETAKLKLKAPSEKQIAEREIISQKAIEQLLGCDYDTRAFHAPIDEAAKNNTFSDMKIFNRLNGDRDFFSVMLHIGNDEKSTQDNLEMVNMLCGGGLDPNAPETADLRKQLFASVVNNSLQELADYPFREKTNLSDKELVENWQDIYPSFYKLAVSRKCIQMIQKDFSDNQYLNKDLMNKVLDVESEFNKYHLLNQVRVREIANPYYAKTDTDTVINNLTSNQATDLNPADLADENDPNMYRLYNQLCSVNNNRAKVFFEDVQYQVGKLPGTPSNEADHKVMFFDEAGNDLREFSVIDYAKTGKTFYAAEMNTPGCLMAYTFDKNTGRGTARPDLLKKTNSLSVNARRAINAKIKESIENVINESDRRIENEVTYAKNGLNAILSKPDTADYIAKRDEAINDVLTRITIKQMSKGKDFDAITKKTFASKETFETYRDTLKNTELIKLTIADLTKDPEALKAMTPEAMYSCMLKNQLEVGKKILKDKDNVKDKIRQNEIAHKNAEHDKRASMIQTSQKAADYLQSKEFFMTKDLSSHVFDLRQVSVLSSMSWDRNALQTLTMGMMLSQGYSVDDVFDLNNKKDREMISNAAFKAAQNGDYKFIRENLLKGLNKLNDYVGAKMAAMDPLDIINISKPENVHLAAACNFLKEFSQEFESCQKNIPENEKMKPETYNPILDRAELLGLITRQITNGYEMPPEDRGDLTQGMLSNHLHAQILTEQIRKLKALPENQGKPIDQIYTFEQYAKTDMMKNILADELDNGDINFDDPAVRRAICTTVQDDTFKDGLNLKLTDINTAEPKVECDFKRAVKMAMERKPAKMPFDKDIPDKRQEALQKKNGDAMVM